MLTRKFARDIAERSASTFAEAFVGYVVAAGTTDVVHLDWRGAAATAGLATLVAVGKAIAAGKWVGSKDSASLDPEAGA